MSIIPARRDACILRCGDSEPRLALGILREYVDGYSATTLAAGGQKDGAETLGGGVQVLADARGG